MSGSVSYLPGSELAASTGPLARYLPPLPEGTVSTWLAEHLSPGALVLDPFGVAPLLAVEAARAGYKVVVAANNPVARFLLEMAARPLSGSELRAGLAELAASTKGDERLEPHLRNLYLTQCAVCAQDVMADAFLWERGASAPYARLYRCPNCSDSGERPATEKDAARAAAYTSGGLHRARALERVAPLDDPDRTFVEEALETYLPRAVYALFTLVNKLESLPTAHKRAVSALLLATFDQANTLWAYPAARQRPRQLSVPPRFRENNIWLALEEAVEVWEAWAPPGGTPLVSWPHLPPEGGGISLFEGRLKDLSEQMLGLAAGNELSAQVGTAGQPVVGLNFEAVLTALPRPNQAYWTLSALWAGWLWGRAAAAPFKSILRRRRFDWGWHSTALHAAFSNLVPVLPSDAPVLGLMSEAEPGFVSAALLAAANAGLDLQGVALRIEDTQAQILWHKHDLPEPPPPPIASGLPRELIDVARDGALLALRNIGEPVSYLPLHTAALQALVSHPALRGMDLAPADLLAQVQSALQAVFTFRSGFARYRGSEHSLEVGLWWLRDPDTAVEAPLADRLEIEVVRFLQKNPGCRLSELDGAMCAAFPGLLTPDRSLVQACLRSYAQPEGDAWSLNARDLPRTRREDLSQVQAALESLGERLGYQVESGSLMVWKDGSEPGYVFYVLASAVVGKVLLEPRRSSPGGQCILVFPGSRAGLLRLKLERDPRWEQALTTWHLIKFRHVRRLLEHPALTRDLVETQWTLDPLSDGDPQLPLL